MDLRELPSGAYSRHPWEVARARLFRQVIRTWGTTDRRPLAVLDVGAGDGYFARSLAAELAPGSRITCLDPHYADEIGPAPAGPDAPATSVSFTRSRPQGKFDVLLMMDVLEHVPDDLELLSNLTGQLLVPGGHALITVPAWPSLYSRHDLQLRHYRRYRQTQLRKLVGAAGLRMIVGGGAFHGLVGARAAQKLLELVQGQLSRPALVPASTEGPVETDAGSWKGGAVLDRLFGLCLRADNLLTIGLARVGLSLPGLSAWALARRP
jgi:2-polyprenyl-3-methyl-5-hydroxy-6-metoxy-1,4-benzoquinol methylase